MRQRARVGRRRARAQIDIARTAVSGGIVAGRPVDARLRVNSKPSSNVTFTVKATSAVGTGPASAASSPISSTAWAHPDGGIPVVGERHRLDRGAASKRRPVRRFGSIRQHLAGRAVPRWSCRSSLPIRLRSCQRCRPTTPNSFEPSPERSTGTTSSTPNGRVVWKSRVSEAEATCIANQLVEAVGADRLRELRFGAFRSRSSATALRCQSNSTRPPPSHACCGRSCSPSWARGTHQLLVGTTPPLNRTVGTPELATVRHRVFGTRGAIGVFRGAWLDLSPPRRGSVLGKQLHHAAAPDRAGERAFLSPLPRRGSTATTSSPAER